MPTIFIVDLQEFHPVVIGCRKAGHEVSGPVHGYWKIHGDNEISLVRKEIGLGAALWNTALAGGIQGRLVQFNRDRLVIQEAL